MDQAAIIQYITDTFPGAQRVAADGNSFFFLGSERKLPFITLVTKDDYDLPASLTQAGVFRLNLGLTKPTYESLFGPPPASGGGPIGAAVFDKPYDFTALDQLLPHPTYAQLFWVCILSPTPATFQKIIHPLLAEAYNLARRRQQQAKRSAHG